MLYKNMDQTDNLKKRSTVHTQSHFKACGEMSYVTLSFFVCSAVTVYIFRTVGKIFVVYIAEPDYRILAFWAEQHAHYT